MKVRYTGRARSDIAGIFAYIAKDDESAARRVVRAIRDAIELVAARPLIGIKNIRSPDTRSRLVSRYPYRVHYSIGRDAIAILAVWHTARRPFENEP